MTLKELKLTSRFRSLPAGFRIEFNRPALSPDSRKVQPLCLVGSNGSGKSNLLQVLANIFYYLETFAISGSRNALIAPTESESQLGFVIHYLMPVVASTHLSYLDPRGERMYEEEVTRMRGTELRGVIITKEVQKDPVFEFYYGDPMSRKIFGMNDTEKCMFGRLLPNRVVGYSSGSNEILSNPFVKMDFYYLEELRRKTAEISNPTIPQNNPEQQNSEKHALTVNRLFYLDYHSNAMMVIANFLMKRVSVAGEKTELDIINSIVNVQDLISFRIRLRFYVRNQIPLSELLKTVGETLTAKEKLKALILMRPISIPSELEETVLALVNCSTTVNVIPIPTNQEEEASYELDYVVDEEMKKAFRDHFKGDRGAIYLFEKLYLLNLLNIENYPDSLKESVKASSFSQNIYDMLPRLPAEERVFYVDDIRLRKNNGAEVGYRQLSDGEHQYLQVAGSLMLMDENATLFLLDEPETHFNPEWRSRLVQTLNQIHDRKKELESHADREQFELVQDILLTTHSPFILSDSEQENVYIFTRDGSNEVRWKKPEINTYGTSVNRLMETIFNKRETISAMSLAELNELKKNIVTLEDVQNAKEESRKLGESLEKVHLFNYLITRQKEIEMQNSGLK